MKGYPQNPEFFCGTKRSGCGFGFTSNDISGEMSAEAAACYRLYAANCLEIAGNILDPERRVFLLRMAQGWTRLADQIERLNGGSERPDGGSTLSDLGPAGEPA